MSISIGRTPEILKNNLYFANRQLQGAGTTIERLFPESWRPLGIKTCEDLINLGKMNLELLSRSPMGDMPEAKILLGAAICAAEHRPVFAPLRQSCELVSYIRNEVEEVLYLCMETGWFAIGKCHVGPEIHDEVINIYSHIGTNGDHRARIAHTCHLNDPYLLMPWEIEILSTDVDYRLLWQKATMMRAEAAGGLEAYREEIHNDEFDFEQLNAALVKYGHAKEKGERPYDIFLNDSSIRIAAPRRQKMS